MRMRYSAIMSVAAASIVIASCSDEKATEPEGDVVDVYTPGSVFTPFTAEIGVGGTIRFHMSRAPDGDGHNAIFSTATPGAPADINVVADTTVTRKFMTRGTFSYLCTVHPGMTGEVIVH